MKKATGQPDQQSTPKKKIKENNLAQYIFLQHKKKLKNTKESYKDQLKSTGKKISFAAAFTDITRRGTLPEEPSIYTVEMTV